MKRFEERKSNFYNYKKNQSSKFYFDSAEKYYEIEEKLWNIWST